MDVTVSLSRSFADEHGPIGFPRGFPLDRERDFDDRRIPSLSPGLRRDACSDHPVDADGIPPANILSRYYAENFFGVRLAHSLMERSGLGTEGNFPNYLTTIDFWNLCLDNIKLNNDEGQGCTPQPLPLSTWGMIFSAVNQMDTIGSGLKRFADLVPLIPSNVLVKIGRSPERVMIHYSRAGEASERGDRYLEIIALVFHCILLWGSAAPIEIDQLSLSSLLDDRDGSPLAGLTDDIDRHGTGLTVSYSKAVLDLPLGVRKYQSPPHHETTTFLELAARIRQQGGRRQSATVEKLRPLLLRGPLSQQQAADRMGISVATLQRRLARSGTSFRLISQEMRCEKLLSLLRTTANLDDIAFDLGFSDRRSLWRACQQWLGMSPTEYRNAHMS
ncbi:hypothetical protein ASE00_06680 [Sphingomonas sp. Root710]|nr:hypothetical protein ASE00_06680 [Sphingomonas sp. Root710]